MSDAVQAHGRHIRCHSLECPKSPALVAPDECSPRDLNDAEIDAVGGGPIPIALGALALASLGSAAVFGYTTGYQEGKDRAERDNASQECN